MRPTVVVVIGLALARRSSTVRTGWKQLLYTSIIRAAWWKRLAVGPILPLSDGGTLLELATPLEIDHLRLTIDQL
jgi:hypothetical protein